MQSISTLGAIISDGYRITAYCENVDCRHQVELDLPALAERLGADFPTVGDPNPLVAKLRCNACGWKRIGLIVSPPYRHIPTHGAG